MLLLLLTAPYLAITFPGELYKSNLWKGALVTPVREVILLDKVVRVTTEKLGSTIPTTSSCQDSSTITEPRPDLTLLLLTIFAIVTPATLTQT